MRRIEPVILIAALGFYVLAMTSQGLIPYLEKSLTRPETLTDVEGHVVPTPHRTEIENLGRKVYIREGCWYCHSQFVRPVNRDTDKWGPVSQAGEFIYDVPQMFGTRRIGPDLSREGNRRSDEWHYAHHWDPRSVEPESMMPAYSWLFTTNAQHDQEVIKFIETYDKNHDGRVTKSELDAIGQRPANFADLDRWPVNADGTHGDGIIDMHDYGPIPSEEMVGVEAYMQKIGTAIGDWRTWEAWPAIHRTPPTDPLVLRESRGKAIFEIKCSGCHGKYGNGRLTEDTRSSTNFNAAYHFLNPQPRDFTAGSFKSRTTPSGALPTDEDLFRTISRGIRKGQIMPAWGNAADGHVIPEQDRWDLVDYIKTFSTRFKSEAVPEPIPVPTPPYASLKQVPPSVIQEGRMVYRTLQCWSCHGNAGKGNGPSANDLVDDWETPIRPFDFSSGAFKFGDSPADVYRTFNTGLNGTPMPSFYDTILYPREALSDLGAWRTQMQGKPLFTDEDLAELQQYVAGLPTSADMDKMSEADKQVFADRRRWALVYYALSLATERGKPPVPSRAGFSASR
ncbi:MAG TPA: cbb3-type cytochrome c oxidase subunit II [Steroidobacteraceae bacterium]